MICFYRKLGIVCALALLTASTLFSNAAFAVSLGEIQILSFLDEPLKANISLSEFDEYELRELKVSVASSASFQQLGIERSTFLDNMSFSLDQGLEGNSVITITTENAVSEPALTLLLELRTPISRHTREYTLLFDPVGYKPNATLSVNRPIIEAYNGDHPLNEMNNTNQVEKVDKVEKSAKGEKDKKSKRSEKSETASQTASKSEKGPSNVPLVLATVKPFENGDIYVVRQNDTLWEIANSIKIEGLNTKQIMTALLQHNDSAFIGGNINRLKVGAKLKLPNSKALKSVADGKALKKGSRQINTSKKSSKNPLVNSSELTKPQLSTKRKAVNTASAEIDPGGQLSLVSPQKESSQKSGTLTSILLLEEKRDEQELLISDLNYDRKANEEQLQLSQALIEIKNNQLVELEKRLQELQAARQLESFKAAQQSDQKLMVDPLVLKQERQFTLKEIVGIAAFALFWIAVATTPFIWLFGWINERRKSTKKFQDDNLQEDMSYDDINQVLAAYHEAQIASVQSKALAA